MTLLFYEMAWSLDILRGECPQGVGITYANASAATVSRTKVLNIGMWSKTAPHWFH
jgi:hypothetical protein